MKKIISILLVIGLIFSIMQINVFATENKIVSITFEDIGVYEGTGNLTNGKYIYSYRPNFSVTLSDGTVKKSVQGMGVEIDGTYYTVKYSDTQAENPWTPGNTYTVIGTVSGVSGKLNVTVYESPITNIEFDDITFAVGDYSYSDNYGTYNGKYDISYVISNRDFRVTEKNGTVRTIRDSYSLGNSSYQPRITTDLPISKWEPGNVYQVTGTLFGISNTFNIHYEENPVQSIEVDDLYIVEHNNGSWMENKSWYYYFPEPKKITIHYKNGSSIYGTRGDIGNKTGYWVNYEGIDQYSNHWELNGTYKAKATYRGVSAYYNVNITESNVESVEINDISIIEGTHGYQSGENYIYYISPKFTVTLKDGRKFYSENYGVYINNEWCSLQIDNNSQYSEPWVAGKTYELKGTILGVSDTFSVTITKGPTAVSLKINDISVIEGTHGYQIGENFIFSVSPSYTVKLDDGREIYSPGGGVTIDENSYQLIVNDNSQNQEPWTAGNTYEVTGSVLGVSDTFSVTITESPIASVEINDTSVIEGFNCTDGVYSLCKPRYKVKLKDGREIESCDGTSGILYDFDGNQYSLLTNETELQQLERWELGGTYKVTGKIGGVSATFNVTVRDNPIKSLNVKDLEIYENTGGYFKTDENLVKYHHYSIDDAMLNFNAELTDGSIIKEGTYDGGSSKGVYIDSQFYPIYNITDNQSTEHWGVGTHKVTAELLGKKTEFNVNIIKNPIVDVEVNDVDIYKQLGDSYFYYEVDPIAVVTYSNGEKIEKPLSQLSISGYYSEVEGRYIETNYSIGNILKNTPAGNYNYYVTVNGRNYYFKVNVYEEAVIESIDCIKYPFKTEYYETEGLNLKGAKFRINYSDKYSEEITLENDSEYLEGNNIYLKKLKKILRLESALNNGSWEISLGKVKTVIPVSVKENDIKSFEIKLNNDKNLCLVVTYNDNTKVEKRIINIKQYSGWYDSLNDRYGSYGVALKTETECFFGDIVFNDNYFCVTVKIGSKKYETNTMYGYNFLKSPFIADSLFQLPYYKLNCGLKHFDGRITADNIDRIINQSIYNSKTETKITYNKSEIQKLVEECFAVKDFDITLSKLYDSKADVYLYDSRYVQSYYIKGYLLEANYINGKYKLKYFYYNNEKTDVCYMTLNDDLKITSIDMEYDSGDVNHDGIVDIRDLVHLKKRLAANKTTQAETNDPADVDKNNILNALDITALRKILLGVFN